MRSERPNKQKTPRPLDLRHGDVYLLALSLVLLCIYLTLDALHQLSLAVRMLLLALLVLLSYIAVRWRLQTARRADPDVRAERYLTPLLLLYAALYLHLLLSLTLLDPALGRDLIWAENSRAYYLLWFVNLRPFHTIWSVYLVGGLMRGQIAPSAVLANLLGNLLVLAPLALLLPLLLRPMRRWYLFVPTAALASAAIEALQFLCMRGSCDIDDLFLNTAGAAIFFFLFRTPPITRLLRRLTYGMWDLSPT